MTTRETIQNINLNPKNLPTFPCVLNSNIQHFIFANKNEQLIANLDRKTLSTFGSVQRQHSMIVNSMIVIVLEFYIG